MFFRLADEPDFFPSPFPESIKLKQMLKANNDKENCGDNISGGEITKCLDDGKEMMEKQGESHGRYYDRRSLQINAGEGVKRTLIHLLMGTEMVQTIWKTV